MYDKRVSIKWNIPVHQQLQRVGNTNKINIVEKLSAPVLAISSLVFVTSIFLLMFIPKSNEQSLLIGTQTKFSTIYTSK